MSTEERGYSSYSRQCVCIPSASLLRAACMQWTEGPAGCFLGTYTAGIPCEVELDELYLGGTQVVLRWGSANTSLQCYTAYSR